MGLTLSPDLISDPLVEGDVFVEDIGNRFAIRRINDLGTFCGYKEGAGKGRNKEPGGAFRWSAYPIGEDVVLKEGGISSFGADIKFDGDVCIPNSLYTDLDDLGLLSLSDLVINSDVSLTPFGMNDRDATGFPQICGRGEDSSDEATFRIPFVLTPFVSTQ